MKKRIKQLISFYLIVAVVVTLSGICFSVFAVDLDLTNETIYSDYKDNKFEEMIEIYNENGEVDGYVVVGSISNDDSYNYNGIIIRYDLTGNVVWQKNYGGSGYDEFFSITASYDINGKVDGYVAVGETSSSNIEGLPITSSYHSRGILVIYDVNGNIRYQSGHERTLPVSLMTAIATNDYIIVAGKYGREFNGSAYYYSDSVLIKYNYIKNNITVIENENGKVNIKEAALPGSTVEIQVSPNKGYEVDKIIVTDIEGNEIKVNDNGFIMPNSDVKIKIIYKRIVDLGNIVNPETSNFWYTILGVTFIVLLGTYLAFKAREN